MVMRIFRTSCNFCACYKYGMCQHLEFDPSWIEIPRKTVHCDGYLSSEFLKLNDYNSDIK